MTGIITKISSGLILAENFESYLNGWTFGGSSSASGRLAAIPHAGTYSFALKTGDYNHPFPVSGYAQFTKSVDVKTGANRVAKVFRGRGFAGVVYDDFLDSQTDTDRWAANYATSGGVMKVYLGNRQDTVYYAWNQYLTVIARMIARKSTEWQAVESSSTDRAGIYFNEDLTMTLRCVHNGNSHDTSLGSFDDSGYHIYALEHKSTGVKVYVDGVLKGTESNATYIPSPANTHTFWNQGGSVYGDPGACWVDYLAWLDHSATGQCVVSMKIGADTLFDKDASTETGSVNNGFWDEGWGAITVTGTQTIELKVRNTSGAQDKRAAVLYFDDLVVMYDKNIKITSLIGGQKVEVYDSGGSLRKSATCPQTGADVLIDISDLIVTAYGFSGYFKIYDTDGATLLYTSSTDTIWGGDVYRWVPNQSKMDIQTGATKIYRTGSGLSPTSCTVTITLKDKETDAKLAGKPINFSSNLGSCNPTQGTTDSNGQASTTYTAGTSCGLGSVRADFETDATYAASSALQLIDIYYAEPSVDATKDFQIWIEGQEVVQADGSYKLSANFQPQSFNFTTPITSLTVGGWWAVDIYRRGTREYLGRIMKGTWRSGANPQLNVSGVDETIMLQRRAANKSYLDEPKLIIEDLLTRYPCGITAGSIGLYGNVIKLDATYENLYDAFTQIARLTGWKFRRNADRTLDFGPDFGEIKAIIVSAGLNSAGATRDVDWSQVDSKVYVVGKDPAAGLVSSAESPAAQLVYGLIEDVFLEKNIDEQGTLDLRAQEIMSQHEEARETATVEWPDTLATGSYGPFDTLTVEDADAELAGEYQVSAMVRKLQNAEYASLELVTAMITLPDAIQAIRKDVKDLAVA
jgi:hypothetical protein